MGTKTKQREAWKAQRSVQQPRITAVMSSNRESTVRENILTVEYMQDDILDKTSIMLFKVLKFYFHSYSVMTLFHLQRK